MRIREFKTKALSILTNYEPKTEEEARLKDILYRKTKALKYIWIPDYLYLLYKLKSDPSTPEGFRSVLDTVTQLAITLALSDFPSRKKAVQPIALPN